MDNAKGYEVDNVVSCCGDCNSLRGDRLSPDETRAAVKAIKEHRAGSDPTNPKAAIGALKPSLSLVPSGLMIPLAKVMELGARKYGEANWRSTKVRRKVYLDAALRHIYLALDGEDNDPESGQEHEAHAAACCGIILDAKALGVLIDDRPAPGPAARLIAAAFRKSES